MVPLLWCEKCQGHTSQRFLGDLVLMIHPMMAEPRPPAPGKYMCLRCETIIEIGDHGRVVEEKDDEGSILLEKGE